MRMDMSRIMRVRRAVDLRRFAECLPHFGFRYEAGKLPGQIQGCVTGDTLWVQTVFCSELPRVVSRPAANGLPDGWFKVDMYVAPKDPHLRFERLAAEPCKSTDDVKLVSCRVVTISGRRWMQRIERDPMTEYRSIATGPAE